MRSKKRNREGIISLCVITLRQSRLSNRLRIRRPTSLYFKISCLAFKIKLFWMSSIIRMKIIWIKVCTLNYKIKPISSLFRSLQVNRIQRTTRSTIECSGVLDDISKIMTKTALKTVRIVIRPRLSSLKWTRFYIVEPSHIRHLRRGLCMVITYINVVVSVKIMLIAYQSTNKNQLLSTPNSPFSNLIVIVKIIRARWVGVQKKWDLWRKRRWIYLSCIKRSKII